MAINLQKGQTIDLRKNDKGESVYDLSSVTMGLGWDVRKKKDITNLIIMQFLTSKSYL